MCPQTTGGQLMGLLRCSNQCIVRRELHSCGGTVLIVQWVGWVWSGTFLGQGDFATLYLHMLLMSWGASRIYDEGPVMSFRWTSTRIHHYIQGDRPVGILSCDRWFCGDRIIAVVVLLRQEGNSHSSNDRLKICIKMGDSYSAQLPLSGRRVRHRLESKPSRFSLCRGTDSWPLCRSVWEHEGVKVCEDLSNCK